MKETSVSVLRCRACSRSADIARTGERFWCISCQAHVDVDVMRVDATALHEGVGEPGLEPIPPTIEPRQPLRIPPGWLVRYNEFYEADPTPDWGDRQEKFMAWHEDRGRLVDMDWRWTEDHPTGAFRIHVLAGEQHDEVRPTVCFEDRLSAARELERVLFLVQVGQL